MQQHSRPPGRVYLAGAGPGDASLVTLRCVECLGRADVVLYDYLVNPQILEHAPQARLVCLGRHGHGRIMPQDEINRLLIAEAQAGNSVVRLKAGDSAVFARAAEETHALLQAGIMYEVVPGITAALAAGSHAGIPITHRGAASAVALVTAHEQDEKQAPAIDYSALAAFPGTLVMYMGVTSAAEWTRALVAAGKPPDTPAAVIRRCSWPDQVTVRCTLAEVAAEIERRKIRPPVITIVGQVVDEADATCWFTSRPLFGQRIIVTRPRGQADALRDRLQELGADVMVKPAIEIGPPADWGPVDDALGRLGTFDWLVFSSANGVAALVDRLFARGADLRAMAGVRLAAIGPGTADELAKYHLRADLVPDEYRAESLAAALASVASGRRFLLARASRGREVLADELRAFGGEVEQITVYSSLDVERCDDDVAHLLESGKIDWMTVTSSAIARSVARLYGSLLLRTRLASISPITSSTLGECGFEPAVEADVYTMEGLVAAILRAGEST